MRSAAVGQLDGYVPDASELFRKQPCILDLDKSYLYGLTRDLNVKLP